MSMLARFKKPGGFPQLVNLIETCAPQKREQLMKLIHEENPGWAKLVEEKMLTIEKIMKWPAATVAEITTRLPEKVLSFALHGLPKECHEKALYSMSHMKVRAIEELLAGPKPKDGEIHAAFLKIVLKARELEKSGELKLEKIDPALSMTDIKAAA